VLIILHFKFTVFQKPDWVNAELKFTLSADSLSSWDSNYEDDQEKLSEVPEYIKKLASQGKWSFVLLAIHPLLRKLRPDFKMALMAVLRFFFVFALQLSLLIMT